RSFFLPVFLEFLFYEIEGLFPFRLPEFITVADQRFCQTFFAVYEIPAELAFDAGGHPVCRCLFLPFNLQDLTVVPPYLECTALTAVYDGGFLHVTHLLTRMW